LNSIQYSQFGVPGYRVKSQILVEDSTSHIEVSRRWRTEVKFS